MVGLYFPSSSGEGLSTFLARTFFVASFILLAALASRAGVNESTFLWVSCPIVIWLCLCTLPSLFHLHEITLTPLAIFSPLAFFFCIKLAKLRFGNLTSILATVSIANAALAIGMLSVESVADFMVSHYNDFSADLVTSMVTANKPVLTFATHSLAGLFIYLFFWLNLRTYQRTGKKLHLVLAVLHVALCILVMSVTSLAFAALAMGELAWNFRLFSALSATAAYLLAPAWLTGAIADTLSTNIWLREGGGFLARYTANGNLADAFAYIHSHPFLPMGLMYSQNLFQGGAQTDSGPVVYFLRGSFVLVALIYGGLFLFLRHNLLDKWDCYRLFVVIVAAETGFSVLTYSRSWLLLPAFVIYLNSLPAASFARTARSESFPALSQGLSCPT